MAARLEPGPPGRMLRPRARRSEPAERCARGRSGLLRRGGGAAGEDAGALLAAADQARQRTDRRGRSFPFDRPGGNRSRHAPRLGTGGAHLRPAPTAGASPWPPSTTTGSAPMPSLAGGPWPARAIARCTPTRRRRPNWPSALGLRLSDLDGAVISESSSWDAYWQRRATRSPEDGVRGPGRRGQLHRPQPVDVDALHGIPEPPDPCDQSGAQRGGRHAAKFVGATLGPGCPGGARTKRSQRHPNSPE